MCPSEPHTGEEATGHGLQLLSPASAFPDCLTLNVRGRRREGNMSVLKNYKQAHGYLASGICVELSLQIAYLTNTVKDR